MEDDLQWKTTFDGRQPSIKDDLQWKTTHDGRRAFNDNLKNEYYPQNYDKLKIEDERKMKTTSKLKMKCLSKINKNNCQDILR